MDSTINNPSIPHCGKIPQPLQKGHIIQIQGTVPSYPTCFSINLQCGNSTSPRSDVALHLSPVFSHPPRVVRNSMVDQVWGPEESHGPPFPFVPGDEFEMLILMESEEFQIAIDGQHFSEYSFKLPLHRVSHICVDGDVNIRTIKFEGTIEQEISVKNETGYGLPYGFAPQAGPESADYGNPNTAVYGGQGMPSASMDYSPQGPTSPYGMPSGAYNPYGPPQGNPYGPPPQSNPYGPPQGNPYGPPSPSHPYGPSPGQPYGPTSPSQPYGPQPGSPYGPPSPSHPYGPQPGGPYGPPQGGGYPGNVPQGGYPQGGYPYPSQPGPYAGTSVVYPGQPKQKDSSGLGPLAALGTMAATALGGAGVASMLGGKKNKKHKKHGYGGGMGMMGGGPAGLIGGVSSLLSPGHKPTGRTSPLPIGGALAGGAAALAGTYMLGKVVKPKKMFKHKHKMKFGGFGSSSSSSSSEEE